MSKDKRKLLLVEDDKNFALVLKSYLEIHFLSVDVVTDGITALGKLRGGGYSLCILDVVMPKMDGFDLAKHIKKNFPELRFVFLTARNLKDDIVKGYELGAIDYLCKPFDSEILLLKICALLDKTRDLDSLKDEEISIGDYLFNPSFRTLSFHENSRKLTYKESMVLYLLTKYRNRVLNRKILQTQIWSDDSYFVGRSLDVFISKLRNYLNHDPRISIENIRSVGFSLRIRE